MKVYRIEHKDDQRGPYTGCANLCMSRYWGEKCPSPDMDGMNTRNMSYSHYFGFAKMKQMFTWFRARDVFIMRKKGFRVYRYKVADEHVIEGWNQLAFVRTKATVREEVKLSLMARHLCSF